MAGSLYAIAMGPAGLDTPKPPVSLRTFDLAGFLLEEVGFPAAAALAAQQADDHDHHHDQSRQRRQDPFLFQHRCHIRFRCTLLPSIARFRRK